MFKKAREKLAAANASPAVDATCFNDPLALQTEWLPLKRGGASFQTNKLYEIDENRLEFKASLGMKCFSGLFVVVGLGVSVFALSHKPSQTEDLWNKDFLFPLIFGLVFGLAGWAMARSCATPIVFDKNHGYFSKNRKKPEYQMDRSRLKDYAELNRIHALQLLAEECKGDKSTYTSYELNLVLSDASRLNVIDHGNLTAVREDARKLADFLDKPVWDPI